jgi:hypothetical protein
MKTLSTIGYLNIELAEYLAFHSEELPQGIIVDTNSYLRTEGYRLKAFKNRYIYL